MLLSGDYEFLTTMYGLSGASGMLNVATCIAIMVKIGRHFCHITYEESQNSRSIRGRFAACTLESIRSDHLRFVAAGNDLKKAKLFNNAIVDHFFDIPIDHVC